MTYEKLDTILKVFNGEIDMKALEDFKREDIESVGDRVRRNAHQSSTPPSFQRNPGCGGCGGGCGH